jgi:SlyX protein
LSDSDQSRVPSPEYRASAVDIERLESKVAYLERANIELSDVVYAQRREIEELKLRLQALQDRVGSLQQDSRPYTFEEEKPPHY